jgi:hypothetical protein
MQEIMEFFSKFPSVFSDEMNQNLEEEVLEENSMSPLLYAKRKETKPR